MMKIRIENKSDFDFVYNLHLKAFGQKEEPELVDKLRDSNCFIEDLSIVAELDNKVIGHILFTKVFIQSEGINKEALALAPMAVLPEFQKTGVGKRLIAFGLDKAKSLGFESVIVLGHADYYAQFGFEKARKFGIICPWEVPDEVFMVLELKKNVLVGVHGLVQYATPFMEL